MEIIYWSVRTSSRRERWRKWMGVSLCYFSPLLVSFFEIMKIWCNIQVILNLFQAVHSDEKKFKCSCGFSTKFSSHLAEHKRTHEGKVHRCTLEGCQYWTAKKTLLNAHMRMHNGEKKFVCKVCSKGFVEAGQLRRHEKIHTNDKKFVCDVENCSYSSTRKVIFHPY